MVNGQQREYVESAHTLVMCDRAQCCDHARSHVVRVVCGVWCVVCGVSASRAHPGDAGETHDEEKELSEERC